MLIVLQPVHKIMLIFILELNVLKFNLPIHTFVFPFFNSSIRVESLCTVQMLVTAFVATVTTGGARGDTKCDEVATGEAGDTMEDRMVDRGGGAGATNPERLTTVSVLVPIKRISIIILPPLKSIVTCE